ncbi:MAG: isopentenyl-diphosphate Delta-isomerase [Cellvibrionales bacterium]
MAPFGAGHFHFSIVLTSMGKAQTTVSFDSEDLILVDSHDQVVGTAPKIEVHRPGGVLHRAFSIFIYAATGHVLLHQRSKEKPLWPGFWTNSCCSHPRSGESYEQATHRRLQEELGIQTTLTRLYQFEYCAHFGDVGSEHELCAVYVGCFDEPIPIIPHPEEVAAWDWFEIEYIDSWVLNRPQQLTPWFLMEWQALRQQHSDAVKAITGCR